MPMPSVLRPFLAIVGCQRRFELTATHAVLLCTLPCARPQQAAEVMRFITENAMPVVRVGLHSLPPQDLVPLTWGVAKLRLASDSELVESLLRELLAEDAEALRWVHHTTLALLPQLMQVRICTTPWLSASCFKGPVILVLYALVALRPCAASQIKNDPPTYLVRPVRGPCNCCCSPCHYGSCRGCSLHLPLHSR